MESIGARIKQAREKKGLSVEQVQKDTRIHKSILMAIEDDTVHRAVSGPIYAKSFIKKYADYLGLDGTSLAGEYKTVHPKPAEQILMLDNGKPVFRLLAKRVLAVAIAIAITLLGLKLLSFVGSKMIAGSKSQAKVAKKEKVAQPKLASTKTPKVAPRATQQPVVSTPQVPKGEQIILSIKARADVYIKVKSDEAVIYDGVLKKGSLENWYAKNSLEISTGRADVLEASLNGVKLGPLGKGMIKGILITRDGLKIPKP